MSEPIPTEEEILHEVADAKKRLEILERLLIVIREYEEVR